MIHKNIIKKANINNNNESNNTNNNNSIKDETNNSNNYINHKLINNIKNRTKRLLSRNFIKKGNILSEKKK